MIWDLVLRPDEVFFVLSLVVPGLVYIYFGRQVLRTDWLVLRTMDLIIPQYVFFLFLLVGAFVFTSDLGSSGDSPYTDPPLSTLVSVHEIDLILIIPLWLLGFYYLWMGHLLVFGAGRDVVVRAVQRLLARGGRDHHLEGDTFTIPSVKMKVYINWSESSSLVGINRRTWDRQTKAWFDESLVHTFTGRPAEKMHPALLGFGVFLLVLGLVMGGLMAI